MNRSVVESNAAALKSIMEFQEKSLSQMKDLWFPKDQPAPKKDDPWKNMDPAELDKAGLMLMSVDGGREHIVVPKGKQKEFLEDYKNIPTVPSGV